MSTEAMMKARRALSAFAEMVADPAAVEALRSYSDTEGERAYERNREEATK